jgi:hypothetical protein
LATAPVLKFEYGECAQSFFRCWSRRLRSGLPTCCAMTCLLLLGGPSIDIRLNSGQSRARVDCSDIETSIGFERQFRTVLCKFPVAIQKYWAKQEIIGKYSRPAARRCRARKLERLLARRLNSSTRFAVLGAHDLAWVEHETAFPSRAAQLGTRFDPLPRNGNRHLGECSDR